MLGILSYVSRQFSLRRVLNKCPVDGENSEILNYNGQSYDRQRFIQLQADSNSRWGKKDLLKFLFQHEENVRSEKRKKGKRLELEKAMVDAMKLAIAQKEILKEKRRDIQ